MRSLILVAVLSVVPGIQASAWAAFCASYVPAYPKTVFCDDFDRYCTSPPAYPNTCNTDGSAVADNGPLQALWHPMDPGLGQCPGTTFTVEEDQTREQSKPYGGRYPCQANAHLGQQEVNLVPGIQANPNFGPSYTAVNGTDANPLYLNFRMNGGNAGNQHIMFDNGYMELGLDSNDGAPMDYVLVGSGDGAGCNDCYHMCPSPNFSVHVPWPTVCQSYDPRVASPTCPPLMTNVRKALAVGAVALLDNNPCHCETPADQVPQNNHLSYYDGLKWRALKSNLFPGNGGDFTLGVKETMVQMWIKTSTVEITLTTTNVTTGLTEVSTATGIPRLYTGPFNKLRGGVAHGCQLKNGSYSCDGKDWCFRTGEFRCDGGGWQDSKAANIIFDDVWVLPGVGSSPTTTGACCLPNSTTCQAKTVTQCQALGGTYGGDGSSCATAVCCYTPWANADGDGDVDQDDFGAFEACYTGSVQPETGLAGYCKCFDRGSGSTPVRDGKIDSFDFTAFQNCFSGPQVPWSLIVAPLCINP